MGGRGERVDSKVQLGIKRFLTKGGEVEPTYETGSQKGPAEGPAVKAHPQGGANMGEERKMIEKGPLDP